MGIVLYDVMLQLHCHHKIKKIKNLNTRLSLRAKSAMLDLGKFDNIKNGLFYILFLLLFYMKKNV